MVEQLTLLWQAVPEPLQLLLWNLLKIGVVLVPVLVSVAWLTFAERKVIGYMQLRIGPNRVGPRGWLQPIADALKLLTKEVIVPVRANPFLFYMAPVLVIGPALGAWRWCRSARVWSLPISTWVCCTCWPLPRWACTG